jgi:hypothetical protein
MNPTCLMMFWCSTADFHQAPPCLEDFYLSLATKLAAYAGLKMTNRDGRIF